MAHVRCIDPDFWLAVVVVVVGSRDWSIPCILPCGLHPHFLQLTTLKSFINSVDSTRRGEFEAVLILHFKAPKSFTQTRIELFTFLCHGFY